MELSYETITLGVVVLMLVLDRLGVLSRLGLRLPSQSPPAPSPSPLEPDADDTRATPILDFVINYVTVSNPLVSGMLKRLRDQIRERPEQAQALIESKLPDLQALMAQSATATAATEQDAKA